jgi:hypothetical protein
MSTNGIRAATYLRVSRDDQTTENQRLVLERVAQRRGIERRALISPFGAADALILVGLNDNPAAMQAASERREWHTEGGGDGGLRQWHRSAGQEGDGGGVARGGVTVS